jgi:SAM-dependent methyltransferase
MEPVTQAVQLATWFRRPIGQAVEACERQWLDEILPQIFGYHALAVEPPWSLSPLQSSRIGHRILVSHHRQPLGEGVPLLAAAEALPLASRSLDLVVLVHTLEGSPHPHALLREVDRLLIPEGHLVIIGFDPWSLWGAVNLLPRWRAELPQPLSLLSRQRVTDWLALLGYRLTASATIALPLPPWGWLPPPRLQRWWPLSHGAWLLVARKQISTVTPIRPRWRTRRPFFGSKVAQPSSNQAVE